MPPPEKLTAEIAKQPIFREMPDFIRRYYRSDRPIELRPVELGRATSARRSTTVALTSGSERPQKLPDDPALHMCALAYASDFSLLDAVMARYGRTWFDERMMPASLDHCRCGFTARSAPTNGCLCAGFAERAWRSWPRARPDLQARRHAGSFRRAGRLDARTQVRAGSLISMG